MRVVLVVSIEAQHDFAASNIRMARQSIKSDSQQYIQSQCVKEINKQINKSEKEMME